MGTSREHPTERAKVVRHREPIDWAAREPVSSAVLRAVQSVDDRSLMELDPLAGYVDPDALEAFFDAGDDGADTRHVSFEYDDYTVHVDGAGHVSIR